MKRKTCHDIPSSENHPPQQPGEQNLRHREQHTERHGRPPRQLSLDVDPHDFSIFPHHSHFSSLLPLFF
jgi:hypothetical protein